MEYLPHNGNAFDSSVSELLNLRAARASGGVRGSEEINISSRGAFARVPPSVPSCLLLCNHAASARPSATGLNYQQR